MHVTHAGHVGGRRRGLPGELVENQTAGCGKNRALNCHNDIYTLLLNLFSLSPLLHIGNRNNQYSVYCPGVI